MIKEEVVWGFLKKENADSVAENIYCREGYEPVIQHVMTGIFSSGAPVAYLVVERKVEE
jgi:hypothetical protein